MDQIRPPAVRVALIGYGYAGRTFHAPLLRATPDMDLRIVSSRDAANVRRDLPDVTVLADPDRGVVQLGQRPRNRHDRTRVVHDARAGLDAGRDVVFGEVVAVRCAGAVSG